MGACCEHAGSLVQSTSVRIACIFAQPFSLDIQLNRLVATVDADRAILDMWLKPQYDLRASVVQWCKKGSSGTWGTPRCLGLPCLLLAAGRCALLRRNAVGWALAECYSECAVEVPPGTLPVSQLGGCSGK